MSGKRAAQAQQWQAHVQRWRASGLSRQAYCAGEELSVSAFGYWVSKAKRDEATACLEPLTLVAGRAPWLDAGGRDEVHALSLRSPEGWELSFARCPPASWLRDLFAGVGR